MSVFIDTSAFIAFINADDEFFQNSVKIFSRLLSDGTIIVSSNYVLLETMVILKSRIGQEAVKLLNDDVFPVIKTYWIDEEMHRLCVNTQLVSNRKKISFVDYTSFEIMRRLNIKKVFTFDSHFKDMGFEIMKT